MRVAIVTGLCVPFDAISDAVRHQRSALLDAGHDVVVFAHSGTALAAGEVVETSDPWWMHTQPDYWDADLVVFHHGIHYELFNALLLGHPRAALVVHFHNITPPGLLDGPARQAACDGLDQLSIAGRAHAAWADSAHNAEVLARHSDIHPHDITVVPLSVPDLIASRGAQAGRAGVLAVGRLVRAKGLDTLVRAWAMVPPGIRARHPLRIIGRHSESEPHLPDRLAALVAELGVADTVSLEADVDHEALVEAYQDSRLFVSASRHEGFCVPVVEALAAGCDLVVTDAGATADTAGGFGSVVTVDDVAQLADAVVRELSRPPRSLEEALAEQQRRMAYVGRFQQRAFRRRTVFEAGVAAGRGTDVTLADAAAARERFPARQARLLDRLGCPRCSAPLRRERVVDVAGAVVRADLHCAGHGLVGAVDDFRPGFLPRNLDPRSASDDGDHAMADVLEEATAIGDWSTVPEGRMAAGSAGDSLTFAAAPEGFCVEFLGHAWSGRVEVEVEGGPRWELELYRHEPEPVVLESGPLGAGRSRVSIVALGTRAPESQGAQVVVRRVRSSMPLHELRPPGVNPANRGNPYPQRFLDLVPRQPAGAMILDCGGGDRRFGDDRVYNLEYMDYELADMYGDGLALPFQDDSFDLVMSQAVLEHVPDPQRAVDEIVRILKPGGLVYFEVAFMQPLHAVPSHYMNVTPHGIEHLCRDLEVVDKGEFGGLAETIEWIGGLVGAEEKLGAQRFADTLASLRRLDESMSDDELRMAASAVYLLGRKTGAPGPAPDSAGTAG